MDSRKMQLQTAVPALRSEATPSSPLSRVVDLYAQRIDEHRLQLEQDLRFYQGKLGELAKIDPLDFTGLKRIYSNHCRRTRELLDSLEQ